MVSSDFLKIPLNTTEIPQSRLNIENKTRSNPLKWNGQFSPQLIEVLLDTYASKKCKIFDPFLGSGTVLLEAGMMGLSAIGTEVNPAAFLLARTYTFINIHPDELKNIITKISRIIDDRFPKPLFAPVISHSDGTIRESLQSILLQRDGQLEENLFQSLIVLLDLYRKDLNEQKIDRIWRKLSKHILDLPYSTEPINVFNADARSTPLDSNWADLVITSPPYINVFNYHQQYRTSLEFLNYDLLAVAKSEIGSNRKHRGNRFLTVIQYCLDMAYVFQELKRISCPNAHWILVVGRESSVRGVPFYNGELVTEVAQHVIGYNLILKQERCFKNRFGQNIFEDILHFRVSDKNEQPLSLHLVRNLAGIALEKAYQSASGDTKENIRQAIDQIEKVLPSPILDLQSILKR
jgi:hypothetical protein